MSLTHRFIRYPLRDTRRYLPPLLLMVILIVAAGLRCYDLDWDEGIFPHPDERSTLQFYAPTIRMPADWGEILDPRKSTLNPFWDVYNQSRRSYTYGHFPLYTLVLAGYFLSQLAPFFKSLNASSEVITFLSLASTDHGYTMIGRAMVGLLDTFSVYLVFLIARRLYGSWAGLLAAALSTFAVSHIQLAHFFAVDPISTTFVLLTVYGSIRMYDRRTVGAAILTGVAIGLAVSSKYSALPAVALPPAMAGWFMLRCPTPNGNNDSLPGRTFWLVFIAAIVSFLAFSLTSPFVLLDFKNFYDVVVKEQGDFLASGVVDVPYTRQYRGTIPYLYFIQQQLEWGLGWPLGLLALAGSIWALIQALRGKLQSGGWIILAWLVPYFGFTGLFLAKFMRYMSPVTPFAIIFGVGLLVTLAKNFSRRLAIVLAVIVLSGSLVWSAMFVNGVYATEHTWVTFARWVYANVPDGSCIAREHWEEWAPASIDEPGGNHLAHNYRQPELPMYEEDTQQKYENLRATLMNCDYIILASNRMWRTIPKLPQRYPMSTRYYQALFSGELGFEQIHTEETPPRLGPFVIDDQSADESFTVYDHPKPILFKKTRQLSAAEWDAILGNTWQEAIPWYIGPPTLLMRLRGLGDPSQANQLSTGAERKSKSLLDTPVDQLPVINDFRWNSLANNSTVVAVLFWWLVVMFIGLLTWPITSWWCSGLPDRGYGLSKSLGLLLVSYFVWLNSSLGWLNNSAATAVVGLVFLGSLNLWIAFTGRRRLVQFWQEQRTLIVATEVVFSLVYLFFIFLRLLNPDLWQPWQGGEKMLEIGFLNAIVKSAHMPPYDPFFAGEIINYYYYGLFLVGVLVKLTGIQPSIAFNLAVPTLAALTAVNVFSLVGNLSQRSRANTVTRPREASTQSVNFILSGLLGVLFVVFISNLEGAFQLLRELGQLSQSDFQSAIPGAQTFAHAFIGLARVFGGEMLAQYDYWGPSRVIPNTINEFPFWSFLFADLHPHMIGIPFTVLFLSLAYNWLCGEAARQNERSEGDEINTPEQASSSPFQLSFANSIYLIASFASSPRLTILSLLRLIGRWLVLPFVLGAIAAINTWDLPTYLGLALITFLLSRYYREQGELTLNRIPPLLTRGILFAGVLLGGTYLLYTPFFLNYQAPAETGLGLVYTQTALDQHLKIWGFFLFLIVSWLWLSLLYPATRNSFLRAVSLILRRWNVLPHIYEVGRCLARRQSGDKVLLTWWGFGFILVVSVGLALLGYHVPAYLLSLVTLTLILLFRREATTAAAYLNLLAFTGLLVLLGVEFFFLRDFLGGGEYYRMNTLFKFYVQVWVMFGLIGAAVLPHLWEWAENWSLWRQLLWRGAFAVLLLATLIYPVLGARARVDDRFPSNLNRPPIGTLDGLAYMTVGVFEWPAGSPIQLKYDYEAIHWLQDNVPGTPIIAEAKVGFYREGGMRVAAYTGLPSILGSLHQSEQHYPWQVGERDLVVNEFWSTPDPTRTLELIDQLDISYIYIGQIERITYGDFIQDKFERLRVQGALEVAFENEQTKIYRVIK